MKAILILIALALVASKPSNVIRGMDVSTYQGDIDWGSVATDDIHFVVIRCTLGDGSLDDKFEQNFAGANSIGLDVSAYHFSYELDAGSAQKAANDLYNALSSRMVPVYYDIEWDQQGALGPEMVTEISEAFLDQCAALGMNCNIYSNLNWYRNMYYPDRLAAKGAQFWIASYGQNVGYCQDDYKPNVGEIMWQCTSTASVAGIYGNVDLDQGYWNGNKNSMTVSIKNKAGVNVRSSPSLDAEIVNFYDYGSLIEVVGMSLDGKWYLTKWGEYITADKKAVLAREQ